MARAIATAPDQAGVSASVIKYAGNSEGAFLHRLCIPSDTRSGIDVVMNRWATIARVSVETESVEETAHEDERHTLWRALLDALCDWAAPDSPTRRYADAVIGRAEDLGDRWRVFGFNYDLVLEQTRLMHVVLHDAFRTWSYDARWLSAFEAGYTVATLAITLGFARDQLERSGRWAETKYARHNEWRRLMLVV